MSPPCPFQDIFPVLFLSRLPGEVWYLRGAPRCLGAPLKCFMKTIYGFFPHLEHQDLKSMDSLTLPVLLEPILLRPVVGETKRTQPDDSSASWGLSPYLTSSGGLLGEP